MTTTIAEALSLLEERLGSSGTGAPAGAEITQEVYDDFEKNGLPTEIGDQQVTCSLRNGGATILIQASVAQ